MATTGRLVLFGEIISIHYSIYCDVCEGLEDLQEKSRKAEPWLNQFSDVQCPDQPGRYLVRIVKRSLR